MKAAINGFGRIGRNAFKILTQRSDVIDIVAINDLTDPKTLAHLLKHDSVFGKFDGTVEAKEDAIVVNGKEIKILKETDPAKLPWKELGVQVVMESTGRFTDKEGSMKHIQAGAKKVVLSAPGKNPDITVVMGVNEEKYDPAVHQIISNASCTTNCMAPFTKIVDREWGIVKGLMTTVHSYTNDQKILDLPHKDLRRARAGALNMIPTTTGAAKAVALVLPQLQGKLGGMSIRVPTPTVSITDAVFELEKPATPEEVNQMFKKEAEGAMKGILGVSDEPLVSMDFKGDTRSSIVDLPSTLVVGGTLLKVVSWYDNEWGYSNRVVDLMEYVDSRGL